MSDFQPTAPRAGRQDALGELVALPDRLEQLHVVAAFGNDDGLARAPEHLEEPCPLDPEPVPDGEYRRLVQSARSCARFVSVDEDDLVWLERLEEKLGVRCQHRLLRVLFRRLPQDRGERLLRRKVEVVLWLLG